jgi:drug/metabolite transporter (DMT)-like permease
MIESHLGEFAALAVAIFWTITALAFESASKTVGSLQVNIIRLLMGFIFLSLFAWFYRGIPFPTDATPYNWFWLSFSGLVGFVLGDLFLFKSFTIIGSRMAMLIMTLAPPITAITGYFFLDEKLGIFSILGIVITFSGIAIAVISHNPEHEQLRLNMPMKGFLFALGGALGQAFGLVLSKKGMNGYDAFAATQIRIITGIIGFTILVIAMGRTKQVLKALTNKKGMTGITIGSFFGPFLGVSFSLISLKYTQSGISATIMSTIPILIIAPSVFIFKQKITVKEIIGAVICVIGVAMFFITP